MINYRLFILTGNLVFSLQNNIYINFYPTGRDSRCQDVICPYGVCRGGICQCPRQCEDASPVCGSDSITYDSQCHLQKHSCVQAIMNLTVAHKGPCSKYS